MQQSQITWPHPPTLLVRTLNRYKDRVDVVDRYLLSFYSFTPDCESQYLKARKTVPLSCVSSATEFVGFYNFICFLLKKVALLC